MVMDEQSRTEMPLIKQPLGSHVDGARGSAGKADTESARARRETKVVEEIMSF